MNEELAFDDLMAFRSSPDLLIEVFGLSLEQQGLESELELGATALELEEEENSYLKVINIGRIVCTAIASLFSFVTTAISVVARLLFSNPVGLAVVGLAFGATSLYALFGGREKEPTYDPQLGENKVNDCTQQIKNSSVIDSIVEGARIVGVDPKLMLQLAKAESAFGANTAQSQSSAKGIFQIIDSTWAQHQSQFSQKYGIPLTSPYDPLSASVFSAAYVKDVIEPKLGYEPSATDVYMMYVFGPAGGKNLLDERRKDPNQLSVDVQSKKGYGSAQIRANPAYFYDRQGRAKTLEETYQTAVSRLTFTKSEEQVLVKANYLPKPVEVVEEVEQPEVLIVQPIVRDVEYVKVGSNYIEVNNGS